MPRCITFALALCLSASPDPQEKSQDRVDQYGDPLPAGAVARLGSVRFHHQGGVIASAFSPDGKTIVAAGMEKDGTSLRFWETATGKELSRIAVEGLEVARLAFTPDGQGVFVDRGSGVELYQRQTGALLRCFVVEDFSGRFALAPDGKSLAMASDRSGQYSPVLHVLETATGGERLALQTQRGAFVACGFSFDGKRLLSATTTVRIGGGGVGGVKGGAGGAKGGVKGGGGGEFLASTNRFDGANQQQTIVGSIRAWDIATGKVIGEVANDTYNVALSPDGQVAAMQDEEGMTRVVNVVTGQTICTFKTPFSALEFTPDGKALLTANGRGDEPDWLWDVVSGSVIRRYETQQPHRLAGFSPDGKMFAVMAGDWKQDGSVLLWNVATGKAIRHGGGHSGAVTAILFAPGNKILVSGSKDCTVRLWESATGKELACLEGHKARITALACSPTNNTLASASSDGVVRLWDVAERRTLAILYAPINKHGSAEGEAIKLGFSKDGKQLIIGGTTAGLQIFDLAAHKPISAHSIGSYATVFALSNDGKLALSTSYEERDFPSSSPNEKLMLWQLADGRQLQSIQLRPAQMGDQTQDQIEAWSAALSSDGRLVAASQSRGSSTPHGVFYEDHLVRVWEKATGQELLRVTESRIGSLAFSPNARLLAAGHGNTLNFHQETRDSLVTVWDVLSGTKFCECRGHANDVTCVEFSGDGKLLASGSADHTILVWNEIQPPKANPPAAKPGVQYLQSWWQSLGGPTADSRASMMRLIDNGNHTVAWLAEQLKPASGEDRERIAKLIEALDSANFKERQQANKALEQIGELAESQLRKALVGNPPLEQRRRLELLLDKLDVVLLRPKQLQMVRTVVVLEWIGTAEARALLTALAEGPPENRLAQLARVAIARMELAK